MDLGLFLTIILFIAIVCYKSSNKHSSSPEYIIAVEQIITEHNDTLNMGDVVYIINNNPFSNNISVVAHDNKIRPFKMAAKLQDSLLLKL